MKMEDPVTCAPAGRYSGQERIGVLEELLQERYSVRAFRPDPVPRETIAHMLTVAQRTASWCNSQPWQVLIASGEAKERCTYFALRACVSGGWRRTSMPLCAPSVAYESVGVWRSTSSSTGTWLLTNILFKIAASVESYSDNSVYIS